MTNDDNAIDKREFWDLWEQWLQSALRTEYSGALQTSESLLSMTAYTQDDDCRLQAHHANWATLFWVGRPATAMSHVRDGLRLYSFRQHRSHALQYAGHDPYVCAAVHGALSLWMLGYPQQSANMMQTAVKVADLTQHPQTELFLMFFRTLLYQFQGEVLLVQDTAERLISRSREYRLPQWDGLGNILYGWALAKQNKDEGIDQITESITRYHDGGGREMLSYFHALVADSYLNMRRFNSAFDAISDALLAATNSGEGMWESEIHRIKGHVLQELDANTNSAVEEFQEAIGIAKKRNIISLELRSVISLFGLWSKIGKTTEAQFEVHRVLNVLPNGYFSSDLQRAREILDNKSE